MYELIDLKRECEAIEIPSGIRRVLPLATRVRISQFLGTSYTVTSDMGCMFRIDAKDADAMGLAAPAAAQAKAPSEEAFSEHMVWDQLKTVFDPEIPVNIVDLGLIYSLEIKPQEDGGNLVEVKMTLTAPGCGMGPSIASDAQRKILSVPGVTDAQVDVVWDPPWSAERISQEGKQKLGMA